MNKIGLNIGNDRDTIRQAGEIVMSILHSNQEQETIRKALDTLPKLFNVGDVTIGDCAINMKDCGCKENEIDDENDDENNDHDY